jgi:hypothetical protein
MILASIKRKFINCTIINQNTYHTTSSIYTLGNSPKRWRAGPRV